MENVPNNPNGEDGHDMEAQELTEDQRETIEQIRNAQRLLSMLEKTILDGDANERQLRAIRTAIGGIYEMNHDYFSNT